MTTVQLEYIVALDTYRSFVTAAEKCFVTQPTLSMQIQKLEDELGCKLFDRSRLPVIPTETGTEVIRQARVTLKENARIKEIIHNKKEEVNGLLRVGIIPTLAPYLMPRVVTHFLKKYPHVTLEVWEYPTEQIKQQIKLELLDCGVLATPLSDSQLKEFPLFYETFVTYVSPENKLANKKIVQPIDIDSASVWILNEGHCMRNQVLNICKDKITNEDHQNLAYYTGSVETLKRLVELSNGYTVLPELSIANLPVQQIEMIRYFKTPEPAREISIVTQRNFIKKALIEAFKAQILEEIPAKMKVKSKKQIMDIDFN